ncbi:MAG: cytochrome P460 family protein [Thermoanaerobaculia bacterium]
MSADRRSPSKPVRAVLWVALSCATLGAASMLVPSGSAAPAASGPRMPAYDEEGRLLLPEDYRRWIFAGSSLGLSYSDAGPAADLRDEMFHEVLIEPTAYEHFVRTGTFREGTMLVLILHGTGQEVLPQRRGVFAAEVHGIEMAVKDSSRFEGSWAYFGFGGMDGLRTTGTFNQPERCQACHAEHAAYDNVFLQFYPMLAQAGPAGGPAARASGLDR